MPLMLPSCCPYDAFLPADAPARLPARLEEDPRTAHAAAIAAAALTANRGNPAAALLDLLHLAMSKRAHQATAEEF